MRACSSASVVRQVAGRIASIVRQVARRLPRVPRIYVLYILYFNVLVLLHTLFIGFNYRFYLCYKLMLGYVCFIQTVVFCRDCQSNLILLAGCQ